MQELRIGFLERGSAPLEVLSVAKMIDGNSADFDLLL
jgi:hypothetical protein